MDQPFSLTFFGGFKNQKKAFLEAKDFAPLPVPKVLETQLDLVSGAQARSVSIPITRKELWRGCVASITPLLIGSALWNTLSALVVIVAVYASRGLLERMDNLGLLFGLCLAIFFSDIVKAAIQYVDRIRAASIARTLQLHLIHLVNTKLLRIDPSSEKKASMGNLKTLISSDVESVEDFITAAAANWIPTAVIVTILTPVIFSTSGWLGLVGIGVSLLQAPMAVFLARYLERYQERAQGHQDKLTTLVGEWVRNIRLVRYLGWQKHIEGEVAGHMRRYTLSKIQHHFLLIITYSLSTSWWMFPIIAMIGVSTFANKPIDLAGFFASIWALNHLTNYIQHIPYSVSMYASAAAGITRLLNLFSAEELSRYLKNSDGVFQDSEQPVRMHLNDVTLTLANRTIIDHISVSFDLYNRTAIVGGVGAGKSLFLELLTGERAPTSGTIEIEFASGVRADLWCTEVYELFRNQIAYTPQVPFLSNSSVKSNVALGDDAADDAVMHASSRAALNSDVAEFKNGYQEEVGETGINLSGGQKQRLSLARAFFSKRPFYVLDDPLSAVDSNTEQLLIKSIIEDSKGFIMVSHRLAELEKCDRIIVLDNGQIVEDAAPSDLINNANSRFLAFLQASSSEAGNE